MLEKRIIDLEIKITYQEDLVNELNQIVTKQQYALEKLAKDIIELKLNASSGDGEGGMKNERPPHY